MCGEKMSKNILVISQYFYPEEFRINDICKEWVERGYTVTVVTGIPNYPKGKFYKGYNFFRKRKETIDGVEIIRLPILPRGKKSIMLALNYLSFVVSGFFWSFFSSLDPDVVFVYEVSPMTQALPGVWFSKRKNIPLVLYVTDLWPENVEYAAGITNKKLLNSIGKMVDYIYKRSNRILTSSRSFIKAIHARGVEKEKLLFWPQYAEDLYQPFQPSIEVNHTEMFNVIFAGNIGYAQGLDILPQVAQYIIDNSDISFCFNIVGDGRYKAELVQLVEEKDLNSYFNFIERQPPENIPKLMSNNHASLVILANSEVFSMTIPAKVQSSLACGIPVLVSANGEVQDVVLESGAGKVSNAGDVNKLGENIIEMAKLSERELEELGRKATEYSDSNFSKKKLLDEIDVVFDETMKSGEENV
jgi:glycosyltransferase involved in cell wall biosynthesis